MNFRALIPATRLDLLVRIAVLCAAIGGIFLAVWLFRRSPITINNNSTTGHDSVSPITGQPCRDPQRPVAVMLASDPEARPLSGIGAADIVFEMPVTPDGITRMMAIYQCQSAPKEIGSIRSARADFIPLAQGFNALFAHWGGEAGALTQLESGVLDNINALIYEGSTFYRKSGIPRPHNGFTTLTLLRERAEDLGYPASSSTPVFPHRVSPNTRNLTTTASTVSLAWRSDMAATFEYDTATGLYRRSRGGTPEIDALTGKQVTVAVVIVMNTEATFLRDQYISVRTTGNGVATIYQSGERISARWHKETADSPLTFTDSRGGAIALMPGTLWVAIDAPLPQP